MKKRIVNETCSPPANAMYIAAWSISSRACPSAPHLRAPQQRRLQQFSNVRTRMSSSRAQGGGRRLAAEAGGVHLRARCLGTECGAGGSYISEGGTLVPPHSEFDLTAASCLCPAALPPLVCHQKMKLAIALTLCAAAVASALPQEAPKSGAGKTPGGALGKIPDRDFSVRDLPADQLRDFPGVCFGSTTFRFYKIGESWPLSPFCGIATCLTDGRHLVERVRDCGLMPKENPKCKVANLKDRNQTFPTCCPKFECEDGVELEYPTPEELQAFAQKARQAQIAAAAAQQQQLLQAQTLPGPGPIARG